MLMKDLIRNNPTENKMPSTVEAQKKAREAQIKKLKEKQLEDGDWSADESAAEEDAGAKKAADGIGDAAVKKDGDDDDDDDDEDDGPAPAPPGHAPPSLPADSGGAIAAPQVMINPETGELMVDPRSLEVRAEVTTSDDRSETIVQHQTQTTYASFSSGRSKNDRWSPADTALFFKGLSAFGTDFDMIERRLLPDRDHNQLKVGLCTRFPRALDVATTSHPPACLPACHHRR